MAGQALLLTPKHPKIFEDSTVAVYVEFIDSISSAFIHVSMKKFRRKHHKEVFKIIIDCIYSTGIKHIRCYTNHPTVARYAKMFGFESSGDKVEGTDGVYREVFELCHQK